MTPASWAEVSGSGDWTSCEYDDRYGRVNPELEVTDAAAGRQSDLTGLMAGLADVADFPGVRLLVSRLQTGIATQQLQLSAVGAEQCLQSARPVRTARGIELLSVDLTSGPSAIQPT